MVKSLNVKLFKLFVRLMSDEKLYMLFEIIIDEMNVRRKSKNDGHLKLSVNFIKDFQVDFISVQIADI